MTACETLRDSIQDYLDGGLAAAARAQFDAHLAACPACRARVARTGELFAALDQPAIPAVPAGFALRVMSRVAESRQRQLAWQSRLLAAAIAVAACAALLFAGGSVPMPGLPEVTDLSFAGVLSSVWATLADLGEGAGLQGVQWVPGLPTGPAWVVLVLAVLALDLSLAYRWRGLARANGVH